MSERTYGFTKSGKPIDDEMIQELADEAERGYKSGQLERHRRGPGRPPLGDAAKSVALILICTSRPYEKQWLRALQFLNLFAVPCASISKESPSSSYSIHHLLHSQVASPFWATLLEQVLLNQSDNF